MNATLDYIGGNQIRIRVSGTDGRGELPANFREDTVWHKIIVVR